MKDNLRHWLPALFCAFISIIALIGSVDWKATWWRPAFFAFLPMCFVYAAYVTIGMQCEIRELRKQVAEMQEKIG